MWLAQHKTQSILLIGDYHQPNECRHKGFVPIPEIITEYLETAHNVDFMIELAHELIPQLQKHKRTEEVLFKLQRMLAPYITGELPRRSNARIHWLDSLTPKSRPPPLIEPLDFDEPTGIPDPERLIELFGKLFLRRISIQPTLRNPELVDEIFQVLQRHVSTEILEMIRRTPEGADYIESVGAENLRSFVRSVINLILETYRFSKCASFDINSYVTAFVGSYFDRRIHGCELLLFDLQRFTMDMYACCRLLKNDGDWYKNIVIYAGATHIKSLETVLTASGYHVRPIDLAFNALCV